MHDICLYDVSTGHGCAKMGKVVGDKHALRLRYTYILYDI